MPPGSSRTSASRPSMRSRAPAARGDYQARPACRQLVPCAARRPGGATRRQCLEGSGRPVQHARGVGCRRFLTRTPGSGGSARPPGCLVRRGARSRRRAARRAALSLISIWEVAKKVENGQLRPDRPRDAWLDAGARSTRIASGRVDPADTGRKLPTASALSRRPGRPDIVATARDRDAIIVTKDEQIRQYRHVRSVW